MMSADPIDRFLQDAEKAARRGEVELALDLLVLALDTAPGDPAVLVRAHAIRDMLPESVPPTDETSPSPPAESTAPPLVPPVFEGKGEEAESPFFVPLPVEEEVDFPGGLGDLTNHLEVEATPPPVVAPEPAPPAAAPLVRQPRRWLTHILLGVLGVALVASVMIAVRPAVVESIGLRIERLRNPIARAEHLIATGHADEALSLLDETAFEVVPSESARLWMAMAEAHMAMGDSASAQDAALTSLTHDGDWVDARRTARFLSDAGLPDEAADAQLLSFERGAPWEAWYEILEAYLAAGYQSRARTLWSLIERGTPPGAETPEPPADLELLPHTDSIPPFSWPDSGGSQPPDSGGGPGGVATSPA